MTEDSLVACATAFLELAGLLLDVDDRPSARFVIDQALALCGAHAPVALHDLSAALALSERLGERDHLLLFGHRVSMAFDSAAAALPQVCHPLKLLN